MDYGPLLSRVFKSAFVVYMYYDKLQNDNGIVHLTYNELNEHLGLASTTIQKANMVLKKLELIEEVEGDATSGKGYRLLPVKHLGEAKIKEILQLSSAEAYQVESSLRKKYLEDKIPYDFQQLLNKRVLKKAYKDLGRDFRRPRPLCEYFKIDYHTFKLLSEKGGENSFKQKLSLLMKEVEGPQKLKSKFSIESRDLTTYLYERLAERNVKPIGNWFMKNCAVAHNLLSNGLTLERGKELIDWGLSDNWWADKITDISILAKVDSRCQMQKAKNQNTITRDTLLPEGILLEVDQLSEAIQVKTYEDAYMLKESVLAGTKKKNIVAVVNKLEELGILPSGPQNLRFG